MGCGTGPGQAHGGGVGDLAGVWAHLRRPRLADALRLGGLTALCRCGARATVDPQVWMEAGLGGLRLDALEDRLRCLCGERRAVLSCGGPEPTAEARPAIHVFR